MCMCVCDCAHVCVYVWVCDRFCLSIEAVNRLLCSWLFCIRRRHNYKCTYILYIYVYVYIYRTETYHGPLDIQRSMDVLSKYVCNMYTYVYMYVYVYFGSVNKCMNIEINEHYSFDDCMVDGR